MFGLVIGLWHAIYCVGIIFMESCVKKMSSLPQGSYTDPRPVSLLGHTEDDSQHKSLLFLVFQRYLPSSCIPPL